MKQDTPPPLVPGEPYAKKHTVPFREAKFRTPEWDAWIAEIEAAVGRTICGATRTRMPVPCEDSPARGRERCRRHGGGSPRGPASPHWKTGARSKYLPEGLRAAYEEALADEELISLRRQLAMCDALETELQRQMSTGETSSAWSLLRTQFRELQKRIRHGTELQINEQLEAMEKTLAEGVQDFRIRSELLDVYNTRRRLSGQELKLLEVRQSYVEKSRVHAMQLVVLDIMRRAVTKRASPELGREILTETSREIFALLEAKDDAS